MSRLSHSLACCCSDEACTSGQLVIASRESQYKILHFHHAGLDKLGEVFQQWKCCRETQLKDQVGVTAKKGQLWVYFYSETREFSIQIFALSVRCQSRNPACSFPSRGPPCRLLRPTQRKSFIGGWMSPLGCVTSITAGRWRRSTNYVRYVCVHMHTSSVLGQHKRLLLLSKQSNIFLIFPLIHTNWKSFRNSSPACSTFSFSQHPSL